MKQILLWIFIIVISGCTFIWFIFIQPHLYDIQPERLPNIPKTAVWSGGIDGGEWFELVKINKKKKTYRIKVYNDGTGDLIIDANFVIEDGCSNKYPLNKDILNYLFYYETENISLMQEKRNKTKKPIGSHCSLKMIQPAYGGYDM